MPKTKRHRLNKPIKPPLLSDIYNEFAETYESNRGAFDISEILNALYASVNCKKGHLLDLGCGAGEPVTKYFLDNAWSATGVDFSEKMLQMASKYVPKMKAVHADILDVTFENQSFDAITATYSLFHIPFKGHKALFKQCYQWLKPNGHLLFTYATQAYTGKAEFNGYKIFMDRELFYSHKTPEALYADLENIGFVIKAKDEHTIFGETFLWVTVSKP